MCMGECFSVFWNRGGKKKSVFFFVFFSPALLCILSNQLPSDCVFVTGLMHAHAASMSLFPSALLSPTVSARPIIGVLTQAASPQQLEFDQILATDVSHRCLLACSELEWLGTTAVWKQKQDASCIRDDCLQSFAPPPPSVPVKLVLLHLLESQLA